MKSLIPGLCGCGLITCELCEPTTGSHLDSNAAEDLIGAQTFVTSSCADRAPPTQIQGKNTNTEIL